MINAESEKSYGQVAHLNSTPFLPILLHCAPKPNHRALKLPPSLCQVSAVPLLNRGTSPLAHFCPYPHPTRINHTAPHSLMRIPHLLCLLERADFQPHAPASHLVFPTVATHLSFLIHHLATSPLTCICDGVRLSPLFCPICSSSLCLYPFSPLNIISKPLYPHRSSYCLLLFQKGDSSCLS